MPVTVRGGDILFNNGTSQTTAFTGSIAWTSVTGRPTDLSSFTNSPEYMNSASGSVSGFNCGVFASLSVASVGISRSGTSVILTGTGNCNCNC